MAPAGCRRIWDHVRLLRRLVTSRWQLHALLWLLGLMALQLAGAEAAFGPWETKRLQATTKTADEQGGWSAKHRLPPASVIVDSAASVCCLCQRTTLCASRRAYRCSWLVSCMCVGGQVRKLQRAQLTRHDSAFVCWGMFVLRKAWAAEQKDELFVFPCCAFARSVFWARNLWATCSARFWTAEMHALPNNCNWIWYNNRVQYDRKLTTFHSLIHYSIITNNKNWKILKYRRPECYWKVLNILFPTTSTNYKYICIRYWNFYFLHYVNKYINVFWKWCIIT